MKIFRVMLAIMLAIALSVVGAGAIASSNSTALVDSCDQYTGTVNYTNCRFERVAPTTTCKTLTAIRSVVKCRMDWLEANYNVAAKPKPSPTPTPTPTPTPSPSPTATPTGVQKNCSDVPSACGYADSTNTGPVAGSVLKSAVGVDCTTGCGAQGTGWHWDSRGYIRVDDNAVVSNLTVPGSLYVTGSNVSINNLSLSCSEPDCLGINLASTANSISINNTKVALADSGAGVFYTSTNPSRSKTNLVVDHVEVTGGSVGLQTDTYGWTMKNSYVHNMTDVRGAHVNGFQTSGCGGVIAEHNTLFNQLNQTDAVMLTNDFGCPQNDDVVNNNFLGGGGWTVYAGNDTDGVGTNINITNNRISRKFFPSSGYFGWIAAIAPGAVVTGNFWDDTLAPATP